MTDQTTMRQSSPSTSLPTRAFTAALTIALAALWGWAGAAPAAAQTDGPALEWPAVSRQTKPWTRWWWHGSSVAGSELTSAIIDYSLAGLGGLEITPIYGVIGEEERFVDFLSPEWMRLLERTLAVAERFDVGVDMATGTGWPFGGPWVTAADAARSIVVDTFHVQGGTNRTIRVRRRQEPYVRAIGSQVYELYGFLGAEGEEPEGTREAPLTRKPAEPIEISDLAQPISANENLQRLALEQVRFERDLPLVALAARERGGEVVDLQRRIDEGQLSWDAPPGDWIVYAVYEGSHGKLVERAAPGGEGYVIDHFSDRALGVHLEQFDRAFAGRELSGLRAFFNDSYEVDDAHGEADWTPELFEAFRSRRGYDLRPHLPALLSADSSEHALRVLSDYRETISDLLLDEFTRPWDAWAETHDAATRNQAHGSPANILDLYAAADIPETEGTDLFRIKMASSAANVSGKPLISAEAATWLNEHFLSNLADVKASLDRYWLGGVNHVVYHGTVYSPRDEPWPGRLFYAAVHLTPANPLWDDFDALNRYAARVQSFLQDGSPDNDVLLYYPIYDRFAARSGSLLEHFDGGLESFEGTGLVRSAETMQERGYAFDFISDRQILSLDVSGADLTTAGPLYRTLVLPNSQFIPLETFRKVMSLVEAGATVLAHGGLATDVPGFDDVEARRSDYRELAERLDFTETETAGVRSAAYGDGRVLRGDDLDLLLSHAGIRREALVDDALGFVRRRRAEGTAYFVVNQDSIPYDGWVPLAVPARSVALFEPKSGTIGIANVRRVTDQSIEAYVQIPAGESLLLQTFDGERPGPPYPYLAASADTMRLEGTWHLEFVDTVTNMTEIPAPVVTDELRSWTEYGEEGVETFSGAGYYTYSFPKPDRQAEGFVLDLGRVHESADVFLNGEELGTLIGPTYRLYIPREAFDVENELEIRVSNLMANRIADLDRRGVQWKKFYNVNFPSRLRQNRNEQGLFDASGWSPVSSGLLGPVTLTPVETLRRSE